MPEERRASDIKLEGIEKKLDEHSNVLNQMRETLQQIAIQQYQLQSLQAQYTELRGDHNALENRFDIVCSFQASCPRRNINVLWGVIITSVASMFGLFMAHMLSGGPK